MKKSNHTTPMETIARYKLTPNDASLIRAWAKQFSITPEKVIRRLFRNPNTRKENGSFVEIYIDDDSELPVTNIPSDSPLRLQKFTISHCDITSLDISNLPELTMLDCSYNNLEELHLSNLPKLTTLYCSSNQLTDLDLSSIPADTIIECEDNPIEFDESERVEVDTAYSVGSFGPFPISITKCPGLDYFYYEGLEYGECGPYNSLDEALSAASEEFGYTDGGFMLDLKEAEEHAEELRKNGYSAG